MLSTPNHVFDGHIELIMGPMFSGKTTELLRRMRRYSCARKRCLVVKYGKDSRYSEDCVSTHDKQMLEANPCHTLSEITNLDQFDCVGIDEGQFFPDLVPWVEAAANSGKVVIVAALDGTFQRKPFGSVLELIPLAEDVVKLTSVCMGCHQPAAFSKRLGSEVKVEVLGGSELYQALCRRCYFSSDIFPISQLPSVDDSGTSTVKEQQERSQEKAENGEQQTIR